VNKISTAEDDIDKDVKQIDLDYESEDKETHKDLEFDTDSETDISELLDNIKAYNDTALKNLGKVVKYNQPLKIFLIAAGKFITNEFDIIDRSIKKDIKDEDFTREIPERINYGYVIEYKFKKFCEFFFGDLGIEGKIEATTPDIKFDNRGVDIKSSKGTKIRHGAKIKGVFDILYGLDYDLLVFNYKVDNQKLTFSKVIYVPKMFTADKKTLDKLHEIIEFIKSDEENAEKWAAISTEMLQTKFQDINENLDKIIDNLSNKLYFDEIDDFKIDLIKSIAKENLPEKGYLDLKGGHWGVSYDDSIFTETGGEDIRSDKEAAKKVIIIYKKRK
jgi:hypothetical protein